MAIPGPVVHQQLMDAYEETQAELEAERESITNVREERDELTKKRSGALVSLAEHYLPELTRDAIESTWQEIQPNVHSLLLRKEDHQRRLETEIEAITAELNQQQQRLLEGRQQLDEAMEKQRQVSAKVEERLLGDERFVELSDRAAVAEAALERAESNLHEIDQDAARKLPGYESSTLFRYLYDRGFGTDAYRKGGFTRRMDRSLARFIGFQKAKSGYEFLKNTPEQMRTLIAQDRQSLETVMDELESRRDDVATEFGLPERIDQTNKLTSERDRLLDTFQRESDRLEAAKSERDGLAGSRGPYYREAIELFRGLLDKAGSSDLNRIAKDTPDVTDDQIVARVLGVETEIDSLDQATRGRRDALEQRREFLAGLGRVIQRFRAAQFDSSRSHFVGSLDIREDLRQAQQYEEINYLWKRIRSAQRWGDVTSDDQGDNGDPMGQLLVSAMGQAKGEHARRAGGRRVGRDSH